MPKVETQVELKDLITFHVSAHAAAFIELDSVRATMQALPAIQSYSKRLVLGGGSNFLFVGDYQGLVIYPRIFGVELLSEDDEHYLVSVGASENWHNLVVQANKNGWYGLENLALIPGTAGAAPVQNVGAYGVEAGDFIHRVEAVDLESGELRLFTNAECQFAYRDSVFKRAGQERFLVTRVEFKLNKQPQLCLDYRPLAESFKNFAKVSPQQLLETICEIRQQKLPDPAELPNAGSFFKNPLVEPSHFDRLKTEYPDIVGHPVDGGVKLAAGWLIDQAGYKGLRQGNVGVHRFQALVLVNYAEVDGNKIWTLAKEIQQSVWQKYGVKLEPEVRVEGQAVTEQ